MKDIKIILLKNPFDTSDVEISFAEFIPGKSASQYVIPLMMGENFAISVNGHIVEDDYVPSCGDNIAVCATIEKGGKNILSLVAMIALSMYAGSVGAGLWTSNATLSSIYAAGVMAVGGMIINSIFPPAVSDTSTTKSDTSYGWSNDNGTVVAQGQPLGITFGTMRTQGSLLSRHIAYDGENQYLSLVFTGGEGEVDAITNITIDDNPIANYKEVTLETRTGTNEQETLENFPNTYADKSLSYELLADSEDIAGQQKWATDITDGNGGEGLELSFTFPAGLFHINNNGDYENAWVDLVAQYKLYGTSEWKNFFGTSSIQSSNISGAFCYPNAPSETWTITARNNLITAIGSVSGVTTGAFDRNHKTFDNGKIGFKTLTGSYTVGFLKRTIVVTNNIPRITSNKSGSFTKTFTVDYLPVGKYEVRCRCVTKSGVTTKDSTKVGWTQLTHIIHNNFARPGKVIVALKILATDQLSGGVPRVSWIQKRLTVNVWNPSTLQYEKKPATNPAWACYDIIHHCRKLLNINTGLYEYTVFGKPANRISYYDFNKWSLYCDDQHLTFNYIYATTFDFWGALKLAETVGRGKVVLKGTTYSAISDAPSSPVQMFSVGNIGADAFKLTYLPKKDRADAVEISFNNKDKDYQKDPITVYGDSYDISDSASNPAQITLDGCDNYDQAVLAGKFFLRLNKYLLRTITFPADIDAIACTIGDVILVNHNVINYDSGEQDSAGGRIVSATTNTVTLDAKVTMIPSKTYGIYIRKEDDTILQKTVQYHEGETSTIQIVGSFSSIPDQYDLYGFGEVDNIVRPYRVTSITRNGELKRNITALEYFDEIYDDDGIIPERYIDTEHVVAISEINNFTSSQNYYVQKDKLIVSNLTINFNYPSNGVVRAVEVYYSRDNGVTWIFSEFTEINTSTLHNVITNSTYLIKCVSVSIIGTRSLGFISSPIYITGKNDPPSNITGLNALQNETYSNIIDISWDEALDVDLQGYVVKYGDILSTWDTAFYPTNELIALNQYSLSVSTSLDVVRLFVKAIDTSGNLSVIPATLDYTPDYYPYDVEGFDAQQLI